MHRILDHQNMFKFEEEISNCQYFYLDVVVLESESMPSLMGDEEISFVEDPYLKALVNKTPVLDEEEGRYFARAMMDHISSTGK